jgi:hypothetical protein
MNELIFSGNLIAQKFSAGKNTIFVPKKGFSVKIGGIVSFLKNHATR